jgi:parvulin-like peptidyl-prolyl isomerase
MLKISKKTILSLVAVMAITTTVFAETNKVYATVNGMDVTQKDVAALLQGQNVGFESLQKEQQRQILDNLIEQKLLADMAYKSNISKTAEYKEELERLQKSLAFQMWLRDFSQNVKIDEKEVKKFYDENKAKFKTPDQLKASHILVKTEAEAKDIIKTLSTAKNIKDEFTKLAKEKSVGPSGANGGELGWFTKEKMVPEFSSAAQKLSKGAITKTPVKTNYGYHVIYLDDKKASAMLEYDKVKDRLKQDLIQQKFAKEAKEEAVKLKKKAKIEYK